MNPRIVLILFFSLLALDLVWQQLLLWLNLNRLRSSKNKPPATAVEIWGGEDYLRSIEYSISRSRLAMVSSLVGTGLIVVLVTNGWLGALHAWISTLVPGPIVQGILYVYLVALIFGIASLPASLFSQFVIEERFGFNRMTWKLYLIDALKSLLLSVLLMTPLLAALFWLVRSSDLWWLWAFLLFTGFQLVIVVVYPMLIAPLFNKFAPLEQGPLRDKIVALAERLNFRTRGIFVMDGSKRSGHANAFFSGLGRVKRIVLFDTLIGRLDENQVAGVLAHEIGHQKLGHILKRLAVSLPSGLIGFYILSRLLNFPPLFEAFGFNTISAAAALVLILYFSGPFTFFLKPLSSWWSRRHEYQADRFVRTKTEYGDAFVEALKKLSRDNLSNPVPHPLYSFYHFSHPTTLERIANLGEKADDAPQ